MKRLSITHSKELEAYLREFVLSVGFITAFQFGANLWLGISVGTYDRGNPTLKRFVQKFELNRRITFSYFLTETSAPEGFVIGLEICGYDNREAKFKVGPEKVYFHRTSGDILS
jgi:hypothetical protein